MRAQRVALAFLNGLQPTPTVIQNLKVIGATGVVNHADAAISLTVLVLNSTDHPVIGGAEIRARIHRIKNHDILR